ncbi:MAG: NAD(+) synthase [Clostridia bacterium]|nr:NAD(+) synthase [Clostridia bacterium]
MGFDVEQVKADLIAWLQNWFEENGPGCNAVIGISGGKDSSVTAALCVAALGRDRVIGVLMPNGVQSDIQDAEHLVKHLGIRYHIINIKDAFDAFVNGVFFAGIQFSHQARVNLPPRLRMSLLYAVSQSENGRVINTCNLSEDWVGYSTRYGDSVGDVCPLGKLTVTEVKELGLSLGLPRELVFKVPSDGLSGKTDEDNLGFTYAVLDRYIRTGEIDDPETKALIDRKHKANLFKLQLMQTFPYAGPELAQH